MDDSIAMRAHASGSAPLSFAAYSFLNNHAAYSAAMGGDFSRNAFGLLKKDPTMRKMQKCLKNPTRISEEDAFFVQGLLVATYSLGDFHTFTETTHGCAYFTQEKIAGTRKDLQDRDVKMFRNKHDDTLEAVPAKSMLGMGVGALMGIVSEDPKVQDKFNTLVTDLLSETDSESSTIRHRWDSSDSSDLDSPR